MILSSFYGIFRTHVDYKLEPTSVYQSFVKTGTLEVDYYVKPSVIDSLEDGSKYKEQVRKIFLLTTKFDFQVDKRVY